MTPTEVREIFDYDPKTGDLLWKKRTGRKSKIGHVAGSKIPRRYVEIGVNGKRWYAHHLVWLWHGFALPRIIDHINLNKHDNRWENLRAVTASQSSFNLPLKADNKSGAKGVSWHKKAQKWQVRIQVRGHQMWIGQFEDFELAELVAVEARNKYHGAFARHA